VILASRAVGLSRTTHALGTLAVTRPAPAELAAVATADRGVGQVEVDGGEVAVGGRRTLEHTVPSRVAIPTTRGTQRAAVFTVDTLGRTLPTARRTLRHTTTAC